MNKTLRTSRALLFFFAFNLTFVYSAHCTIVELHNNVTFNKNMATLTGRGISFRADQDFEISRVEIYGDIDNGSYDAVIFSSTDGHQSNSILKSSTSVVGGNGEVWNGIDLNYNFTAGTYYVILWRPSDGEGGWDTSGRGIPYFADCMNSACYNEYNDGIPGLPFTVGPVTLIDGVEGFNGTNFYNVFHPRLRIIISGCIIPPGGLTTESLLSGREPWCPLPWNWPITLFQDEVGNKFELFCSENYILRYFSASGTTRDIARCVWTQGYNLSLITHSGDNNEVEGSDCIDSVFWRNWENYPNRCNEGTECPWYDWKVYVFYPQKNELILKHFRSTDGPGRHEPDFLVKSGIEGIDYDFYDFNPHPNADVVVSDVLLVALPCDIDFDNDCDQGDINLAETFVGQCENMDRYNEPADADHDGCITQADLEMLFQSDFDHDGYDNIADNCPMFKNSDQKNSDQDGFGDQCDNCPDTPNPDQADSDRDGIGDACQCRGDFDLDGDVDDSDLTKFVSDFGRTNCSSTPSCVGDFDKDNDCDASDLAVFAKYFGRTDCPVPIVQ